MASKSTGQIIGTVVGAVVGFFAGGNVALGAAIGGAIGGLIDPPTGPTIVGPRLDDLSFQTSTIGAPLGRAYGTVPMLGNVVWLEGDAYREVITSEEQGGKGGSSATYETAHYYATFAVSLLRVTDATKTVALRRMWIGSNLVYDAGSDDIESIIASNSQSAQFTFYSGTDDQQPNTRWQADKGANAVSGFPGRCYIVIYDLDLEPYSRSLAMAQVKCELAVGSETLTISELEQPLYPAASVGEYAMASVIFSNDGAIYVRQKWDYTYASPVTAQTVKLLFSDVHEPYGAGVDATGIFGGTRSYSAIAATDTDTPISVVWEVGAAQGSRLILFSGGSQFDSDYIPTELISQLSTYYCCYRADEGLYVFNGGYDLPVFRISGGDFSSPTVISSGSYASRCAGLSENYLFLVAYVSYSATTTIYRLNKNDLSLDETWTSTIYSNNTAIHVVDDETVYTVSYTSGVVYKWVSGVVVGNLGAVVPSTFGGSGTLHPGWFRVIAESPPYVLSWDTVVQSGFANTFKLGHEVVPSAVSKLHDIVTAECGLAGVASGDIDLTALTNSNVRGYRIANAASIRSSLEVLQAAYPFDVAPSGYKLRFLSRGGSSLATIPETDLGATDGGDKLPVLLPVTREMDTQIPYKVSVRYLDQSREYDIAEQYAERPDTASVNERTVELSIVLTGDEAVQIADVLNQKDWIERSAFGPFSLPPTWRAIEPPDVVTVEHRGQSHTLRLTRAEFLPDGRIECAGVLSSAQSYTSTASAQDALTVGQSLVPLAGSTTGYLLDIPRIRAEQDVPGMAYGLTGMASGWPGGVLLRSDDSGNTWPVVGAMNARAKVFVVTESLASHHGYSIDHSSVLTVTPRYSAHTLAAVTEDQLYAHTNLAAYGADGRWEIVAFKTVTDNTGSYTINDFLRGLYGTEWATGLHESGDLLIMLDTATIGFFGLPTVAIGSPRQYRSVTQGATIDSAADVIDTYDASNIKPLSPVDINGSRTPLTLDWTITASRRSRSPVELFSGIAVPIGETSESYEVDIFESSSYATLKRTISVTGSPSIQYTAAMQIADFGSEQQTLYLKWYMLSTVVGRGFPMTQSITRVDNPDPYLANVVLLMHMDTTALLDATGKTVTIYGNAARSSAQSKFGGYSAIFDGAGDYLSIPSSTAFDTTVDFTVELFVFRTGTGTTLQWLFGSNFTGAMTLGIDTASYKPVINKWGTGNVVTGTTTIATNTWYHLAMVKSGTTWTLYVNGVSEGTPATDSGTNSSGAWTIGGTSTQYYLNGHIEELRVTKGVARYLASFTVPTSAFPDP